METKKLEVITSNPANWKRVLNGYELESGVVLNDALVGGRCLIIKFRRRPWPLTGCLK